MTATRLITTARHHCWRKGSPNRAFISVSTNTSHLKTAHAPWNYRSSHSNAPPNGRDPLVEDIIKRLQPLGSGPLCDADKGHRLTATTSDDPDIRAYAGLSLMCPNTMKLRSTPQQHTSSDSTKKTKMIGVARTVQLTRPNDFLAVLHALTEINSGDVLVVNTSGSTRAVAGSLFTTEAERRGCRGLVVDGPVRDVADLACPTYSTMVTPYAGTVQQPGEGIDVTPIICGGVTVHPGDIIFGDGDGVLVGSAETFATCLPDAENIDAVEQQLIQGMKMGIGLHKLTNFDEHIEKRRKGEDSKIEFKDLHTIKFNDMEPIHYD